MQMTMKYRTKPVEIEAWQFIGLPAEKPPKWFLTAYHAGNAFVTLNETKGRYITLVYDGNSERASPGDWIIYDGGKLRICHADTFQRTYECIEYEQSQA